MQHLKFLIWPAIAGLLAALLILDRWVLPESGPRGSQGYELVSYANAVRIATPAVVNIYTAKLVKSRPNPLLNDGFFQRFASASSAPWAPA
jgi:serine protease DegS